MLDAWNAAAFHYDDPASFHRPVYAFKQGTAYSTQEFFGSRKRILPRHEVVCDESFSSGADVLLGKYVKDVDDIVEFHAITNATDKPRHVSPDTVRQFFQPNVSLGPHKRLNSQYERRLKNTCSKSAPRYIRDRCATLHNKTFSQARLLDFPSSDDASKSKRRKYVLSDLTYDLKHGHLQYDWTPLTVEQRKDAIANMAAAAEEHDYLSTLSYGTDPQSHEEAMQRDRDACDDA